jgi:D-alanine-D-alanine ligase
MVLTETSQLRSVDAVFKRESAIISSHLCTDSPRDGSSGRVPQSLQRLITKAVRNINRVLVLYDLPEPIIDHDNPESLCASEERVTERDVCRAIKRLGIELHVHGVFDDFSAIVRRISSVKPDVIFNLCETYVGDRAYEGHIASLLELSGIPYTGSSPSALHLCKNKGTTKKIASWDGVVVPAFATFRCDDLRFERFDSTFPLLVKPLNREASEGISQASLVYDWPSCENRVKWVTSRLKSDVIVEEFIHGRELYLGVIDIDGTLHVLPPRELFFDHLEKNKPMVATFRAKWDEKYRERWGVSTSMAGQLDHVVRDKITSHTLKIFRSLGLESYARIDWRLTPEGEPVFLEANPNPALSQDDDFAQAAKSAGFSYQNLIAQILLSAVANHENKKVTPSKLAG